MRMFLYFVVAGNMQIRLLKLCTIYSGASQVIAVVCCSGSVVVSLVADVTSVVCC